MNRPFLWSENVIAEAYDRQVNDNPEYVIKKLHDDIAKLKEQNQNAATNFEKLRMRIVNALRVGDLTNNAKKMIKALEG